MIQASTRIGIVPLSNHIFSIRIMFQNQSVGGLVCLKSDSKKRKFRIWKNCGAILFASKKSLYTNFGHRTVCLGIDDFRQKNQNFRLRENHSFGIFNKNLLRFTLNDAEKSFSKIPKTVVFSQSKVLNFFVENRLCLHLRGRKFVCRGYFWL